MKIMKRLFDYTVDLKLRLFYVLACTACVANTIGYVSNAILYGFTLPTLFPFGCALVIYSVSMYGFITQKTKASTIVILFICNMIEFPILYFSYGPYQLSYMILGLVATALFVEDAHRFRNTFFLILFDCLCILLKICFPNIFLPLTAKESTLSIEITFLIATMSILALLCILLRQYNEQQDHLKKMAADLENMANLDPLTQLYNRRYLTQYLENKIKNKEHEFTVVLLDIDDFKLVNDQFGHTFGDEVLVEFSNILLKHVQKSGIVTRYGGEEFMLVMNSVDKDFIQGLLEKCSSDFKEYGKVTRNLNLTFSGGVAKYKNEGRLVELFDFADVCLYQAKRSGKAKVVFKGVDQSA